MHGKKGMSYTVARSCMIRKYCVPCIYRAVDHLLANWCNPVVCHVDMPTPPKNAIRVCTNKMQLNRMIAEPLPYLAFYVPPHRMDTG